MARWTVLVAAAMGPLFAAGCASTPYDSVADVGANTADQARERIAQRAYVKTVRNTCPYCGKVTSTKKFTIKGSDLLLKEGAEEALTDSADAAGGDIQKAVRGFTARMALMVDNRGVCKSRKCQRKQARVARKERAEQAREAEGLVQAARALREQMDEEGYAPGIEGLKDAIEDETGVRP